MNGKPYIKIILGIIFIATVSTILLEFSIRVYSNLFFPKMMELDEELGWRHTRDGRRVFINEDGEEILVKQNKYGFRGKEYDKGKTSGKHRILILGDSFTEAVQATENGVFTALIEKSDPRYEVINAGVGGYGTVQEYLFLSREGISFHPNTVILMFYNNDLTDNCLSYSPGFGPRPYISRKNEELYIETALDTAEEFRKFLLPVPFAIELNKSSYLYYFINSRIYHKLLSVKFRSLLQIDMDKARECGTYEAFYHVLTKMHNYLSERGVNLVLVLIPSKEEAHEGSSTTHAPIIEHAEKKNIIYLPLTMALHEASESGSDPYFPEDIHWNSLGHRIAAKEIINLLKTLDK